MKAFKLLAGPPKNVRPIKSKRVIKYQKDDLSCSGYQGTLTIKDNNANDLQTQTGVAYSFWTHSRVPFGAAAVRIKVTVRQKRLVVATQVWNLVV